jgi:branched-subunit amino acid ABC-type transport system permease component
MAWRLLALVLVIVTLGLLILLNSGAGWIWGFSNRSFPSLFGNDSVDVAGVRIDVEVIDVHGNVATVVVRSSVYREYLHLVRTPDGWKIANALWDWA